MKKRLDDRHVKTGTRNSGQNTLKRGRFAIYATVFYTNYVILAHTSCKGCLSSRNAVQGEADRPWLDRVPCIRTIPTLFDSSAIQFLMRHVGGILKGCWMTERCRARVAEWSRCRKFMVSGGLSLEFDMWPDEFRSKSSCRNRWGEGGNLGMLFFWEIGILLDAGCEN